MKWRKFLELSTSSSPPRSNRRASHRMAGRCTAFETLENRKLFAADLAEIPVAELFSSDGVPAEEKPHELMTMTAVKFDETAYEVIDFETFDFANATDPKIRMMTFRGGNVIDDVVDDAVTTEVIEGDQEIDPAVLMTMTGMVSDIEDTGFEELEVRILEADVDLAATSGLAEDTAVIDDVISDDDLIFYTMGPGSEVETTNVEESLTAEDVNGDGIVTALDMLLVINALNSFGSMPSSQLAAQPEVSTVGNWDVNRDGYVTPLDALLLTNYFNNDEAVDSVESTEETALVAPMVARIRNPVEDEPIEDAVDTSLDYDLA